MNIHYLYNEYQNTNIFFCNLGYFSPIRFCHSLAEIYENKNVTSKQSVCNAPNVLCERDFLKSVLCLKWPKLWSKCFRKDYDNNNKVESDNNNGIDVIGLGTSFQNCRTWQDIWSYYFGEMEWAMYGWCCGHMHLQFPHACTFMWNKDHCLREQKFILSILETEIMFRLWYSSLSWSQIVFINKPLNKLCLSVHPGDKYQEENQS